MTVSMNSRSTAIRKTLREQMFDFFNVFFMLLFCMSIIYPVYLIVINSISTEGEIFKGVFRLPPKNIYWGNWIKVFNSRLMISSFLNSVFVTVAGTLYNLFLSTTYAYALSRKELPWRKFWTWLALFTMFFSGGLIPYYLVIRSLGLVDSRWVMVVGTLGVGNTVLIRNFIMAIPPCIEESAKIDGANEFIILYKIILPICKPIIATVSLWLIIGKWNEWMSCMYFINDINKYVVQIVLRDLLFKPRYDILSLNKGTTAAMMELQKYSEITNEGLKAAVMVFTIAPVMMTYPYLQKHFVKGIIIGSLKG